MSRVLGMTGPKRRTEILDELDQESADIGGQLVLGVCGGLVASAGLLHQNEALLAASILFAPIASLCQILSLSLARGDLARLGRALVRTLVWIVCVVVISAVTALVDRISGGASDPNGASLLLPAQSSVLLGLASLVIGGLVAYGLFHQRLPALATNAAASAVVLPSLCLLGIGAAQGHAVVWHAAIWQGVTNASALLLGAAVVFITVGYPATPISEQQVRGLPAPAARFLVRSRNLPALLLLPIFLLCAVSLVHAARVNNSASLTGTTIVIQTTETPLATGSPLTPQSTPRVTVAVTAGPQLTIPAIALTPVSHPTAVRAGTSALITGTHGLGANVRQTAGMTQVIAVLEDGSTVKLTGKQEVKDGFTWLEVRMANGTTGWVSDIFLQVQ